MVALIVITGILLYAFVGCVAGMVFYRYLMNKDKYWYDTDAAMASAAFGFFWPVAWLFLGLYIAMKVAIVGTVNLITNRFIKEK
jgi:TRAP-type C4-dicarboxylate transport system permease small subunit